MNFSIFFAMSVQAQSILEADRDKKDQDLKVANWDLNGRNPATKPAPKEIKVFNVIKFMEVYDGNDPGKSIRDSFYTEFYDGHDLNAPKAPAPLTTPHTPNPFDPRNFV